MPFKDPDGFRSFDFMPYNRKNPEKALGIENTDLHIGTEGFPKANQERSCQLTVGGGGKGAHLLLSEGETASAYRSYGAFHEQGEASHSFSLLRREIRYVTFLSGFQPVRVPSRRAS